MLGDEDFVAIWPRLVDLESAILAQELICEPECGIESFHAYVDQSGAIPGEFIGRKIRTLPARYGHSTAVEVTFPPDVAEPGRAVLARLGLRGVGKLDFKRDERCRLHLLEINARFNLWHYPGAVAGVNLPRARVCRARPLCVDLLGEYGEGTLDRRRHGHLDADGGFIDRSGHGSSWLVS